MTKKRREKGEERVKGKGFVSNDCVRSARHLFYLGRTGKAHRRERRRVGDRRLGEGGRERGKGIPSE